MGRKNSRRVYNTNTNPSVDRPKLSIRPVTPSRFIQTDLIDLIDQSYSPTVLSEIEDRRRYHPSNLLRPAVGVDKRSVELNIPDNIPETSSLSVPVGVQFREPNKVLICHRRKVRREVIFAKGKGGSGRRRPPRKNDFSDVSC